MNLLTYSVARSLCGSWAVLNTIHVVKYAVQSSSANCWWVLFLSTLLALRASTKWPCLEDFTNLSLNFMDQLEVSAINCPSVVSVISHMVCLVHRSLNTNLLSCGIFFSGKVLTFCLCSFAVKSVHCAQLNFIVTYLQLNNWIAKIYTNTIVYSYTCARIKYNKTYSDRIKIQWIMQ